MTDILIVGSGAAGLTSALFAKQNGANVKVVSKTFPTHSQTTQAQGGMNAVICSNDSIEHHIEDTFRSSHEIGDINSINYLCQNAPGAVKWLDSIGVPFSRDENGNVAQRKLGGAKHARACYSSDYTGLKIVHTLYDNCLKEGIEIVNEHMMLNFIVEKGTVKGITALDIVNGEVVEFLAKSTIIATGGYAGIYYNYTTNSYASTGDGLAAAIRAGVRLKNMEFIQFHPTALKENNILISESARGEGGYLIDGQGKRFVDELKPRDEVARAIYSKLQEDEEVFLDVRHLGEEKIKESMPQERELVMQYCGKKMEEDLIPINPAAHYSMGGIETDTLCRTNIKGLFACGECADNGVHGANRLGGNSLLELIVFGKCAAKSAMDYYNDIEMLSADPKEILSNDKNFIDDIYNLPNKLDFYERRELMGEMFYKDVGLFRTDSNLKTVLSKIKEWKKELTLMGIGDKSKIYNKNLIDFIEFGNMLELCETITISAINRTESRGAHYRLDHPFEDEAFRKKSLAWKEDGTLKVDLFDLGEWDEN